MFQQLLLYTLIENNRLDTFSIRHCKPRLLAILMLIDAGFVPNKVCILGTALKEQFLENSRRSAKAGNGGLFSVIELSSLILTLELK
jgi:hypothetical protein